MPGSFHGINLAGNALRAFQYGMDITGHNMANVNTAGYTRQTVEYGAVDPLSLWQGKLMQLGQGVTVTSINRIRDQFLDARMQESGGNRSRFETLANGIGQVEGLFNEPGPNGIAAALDKFFNAWSALGSNPGESANRLAMQQAGTSLAAKVRNAFAGLNQQQAMVQGQIQQSFDDIDRLTGTIAELNHAIREQVAAGGSPNDLLDRRDVAVEQLSQIVNITTAHGANGEIAVHFGGYPLVDVAGSHPMPDIADPANYKVSDGTYSHDVRSGRLYGLFEVANKVEGYKATLDTLANSLRAEVNAMHRTGINANGTTDIRFFAENPAPPQNGAIDFALSAEVAADPNNIATGISGAPGDGGLAISLSNLRSQSSPLLGNRTYAKFYGDAIAGIGGDAAYAADNARTHEAMVRQIEQQRQNVIGVSLDDEMANMLRLQKSYQAAAKVLSVFDQMTEELIGLVR